MKKTSVIAFLLIMTINQMMGVGNQKDSVKPLDQLQQEFLDLRFGMFIHFNISTFTGHDWPDPNESPDVFNPTKLDCDQWAEAAVSAGMTYGCLTTKHHSGFCIWPTATADYNVMNSPLKRDVVKEYADAFRKRGLKVFLYYSILDTHHNIRKGWVNKEHTQFIKDQLTELFTYYGEIDCLVIDGWDAGWSRISYEEISFDLPAQAGIPINKYWFWKEYYPEVDVKDAEFIVHENLIPLNKAHCNFILNVAPNTDGLIDENAIEELKRIGKLWAYPGKVSELPVYKTPIIASNLAKGQKMNSSWSYDMNIYDFANDDNFQGRKWKDMAIKQSTERIRIPSFDTYKVEKVRILVNGFENNFGISEMMVYKTNK